MSCQEIDNKVSGQVTQTQLLILGMSLSLLPSPLIGCRGRRLLLLAVTLVYTCQLPTAAQGEFEFCTWQNSVTGQEPPKLYL